MDINKEREAFEVEFSRIKSDIAFWVNTWDEEMQGYNHPVMCWFWHMWQAAKAQAVPEGFVLVPMCASEETKQKMLIVFNESDGFLNCENIYKAMIEAQEPAND